MSLYSNVDAQLFVFEASAYRPSSAFSSQFWHPLGQVYLLVGASLEGTQAEQAHQVMDTLQAHLGKLHFASLDMLLKQVQELLALQQAEHLDVLLAIWSNYRFYLFLQGCAVVYVQDSSRKIINYTAKDRLVVWQPKPGQRALFCNYPLFSDELIREYFVEISDMVLFSARLRQVLQQRRLKQDVVAFLMQFEEAQFVELPSPRKKILLFLAMLGLVFIGLWVIHAVYSYHEQRTEAEAIAERRALLLRQRLLSDSLRRVDQKPDTVIIHRVRPGETAFSIAKRYAVTLDSIRIWNDYVPLDRIQPGFRLRIRLKMVFAVPEAMTLHEVYERYFQRWAMYGLSEELLRQVNFPNDSSDVLLEPGHLLLVPQWRILP